MLGGGSSPWVHQGVSPLFLPTGVEFSIAPFSPHGCRGDHHPCFLLVLPGQLDHSAPSRLQLDPLLAVHNEEGILRHLWDLRIQPPMLWWAIWTSTSNLVAQQS